MSDKNLWAGKKFEIHAWENNGRCEIEEFLELLRNQSHSDWKRIISLITYTAENGHPEGEELCRLALCGPAIDIYEFVSGGSRIAWFYFKNSIVLCSGAFASDKIERFIENAVMIKEIYVRGAII